MSVGSCWEIAAFQADDLINVGHQMIALMVSDGHVEQWPIINAVLRKANPIVEIVGNNRVPGFVQLAGVFFIGGIARFR